MPFSFRTPAELNLSAESGVQIADRRGLIMSRFNPRILIVDDNPAIHEDFRKIFSPIGNNNGKLEAAEAVLFGESGVQKPSFKFELEYASQGKEALTLV